MLEIKRYFNRRLSAKEVVAAVVIIAVLATLALVGYNFVSAKILEAHVNAAIPRVCDGIRDQRQKLVSAIEAYKAHFGVYPPDHIINRQPLVVDAVTNWLVYELVGVTYNPTNRWFQLGGMEPADAKFVKDFFQCDGFKNSGDSESQLKHFLPSPPSPEMPLGQLHDDPDIYVLGFTVPYEGIAQEVVWEINVSPWRYVSSSPTNNLGQFDLWIELQTKSRKVIIGNWKTVE